jgi:hypothetical protein
LDTLYKCGGIKFGAKDFVRAIGQFCDPPVTDERDYLPGMSYLDLRAHVLGIRNARFPLYINKNEVIATFLEHVQSLLCV